jgi:hypothetical protein
LPRDRFTMSLVQLSAFGNLLSVSTLTQKRPEGTLT